MSFRQIRNWLYLRVYLPIFWIHNDQKKSHSKFHLLNIAFKLFPSPRPHHIKMDTLRRHGGRKAWVETGTYMGDSAIIISEFTEALHTIEPSSKLSNIAKRKLGSKSNVYLHEGTSENLLPDILESLIMQGYRDVSFWLDGHFSGGETYRGKFQTPVKNELDIIANYSGSFSEIQILIDDVRCFNPKLPQYMDYPDLWYLVDYSNSHNLKIFFTRDICIMKGRTYGG